ncbi:MAG: hypothetical protein ABSD38_22290 [Syntrophorhabdales bacterium]
MGIQPAFRRNQDTGSVQERTRGRILADAEEYYAGKFTRIDVRFRAQFCYVDAYVEPDVPGD